MAYTENFEDWINNYIIDNIYNLENENCYGCDIAWELTRTPNDNGTCSNSTEEAKEFIKNNFDKCGEYIEYEKFNFGQTYWNPFEEPNKFQVCMLIWGVENKLAESETLQDSWNDRIVLTKEVIETIKKELGLN